MSSRNRSPRPKLRTRGLRELDKAPSGVPGLDEITGGGLPRGRTTLVCGGPGCGKTLFGVEFLVRGATDHGEPGVLLTFEETTEEIAANVASLGFDVSRLIASRKLAVDHVRVERHEIEETGEFSLDGLFVRLALAVESVGAKRVVLDTVESLFATLPNPAVLRSELRRLFHWLKDHHLTAVVTAERGNGGLTRSGLEEYVSDCVIALDHRVVEQVSTRRLRILKYRGAAHGTNEYPFLIDRDGLSVVPITSLGIHHPASGARVSTGIARLDAMLGGRGLYKGSVALFSGGAGAGKTTLAAGLARAAGARRQRALFLAYEESPAQLTRNMASVGIDLATLDRAGMLRIVPLRPQTHGLEMHLMQIHRAVSDWGPALVVVDPITSLMEAGTLPEVRATLARLIDSLKARQVTTVFTSLTPVSGTTEDTRVGISSLVDTWIVLETVRSSGERNSTLTIVKSRGMAHSRQLAEYTIGSSGIHIVDPYVGPAGALTGSARLQQEALDRATAQVWKDELARLRARRARNRRLLEVRIAGLREEFAAEEAEIDRALHDAVHRGGVLAADHQAMSRSRGAFAPERARRGARR